ncbi:MAG: hypothetical protein LBC53_09555 [Spirochaetaceae bacterium]|jgi:hypothetical protein|nr:hypothetical protein [Spirochaetaceae bacterium]
MQAVNDAPVTRNRAFYAVSIIAVLLAAANVGQYLHFAGRLGEDAVRGAERERELKNLYTDLEKELDGELRRKRKAVELVEGIKAAVDRTSGSLQAAIGLVRTIREELETLEACLNH